MEHNGEVMWKFLFTVTSDAWNESISMSCNAWDACISLAFGLWDAPFCELCYVRSICTCDFWPMSCIYICWCI